MPKQSDMRPSREIDTSTYAGRFAARIRELREKNGMTLGEFAEATGIHKNSIQQWETGRCSPPVNAYPILAKALKTTVRNLMPKE